MMLKDDLFKLRDFFRRCIGRFLFDKVKCNSAVLDNSPIVFIRWDSKLGDAIVSSWVAREIKKQSSGRKVWVVTSPSMAPFFKKYFGFDKIIEIEKRPSYKDLYALAKELEDVSYLVHLSKHLKMKDMYFISRVHAQHVIGIDDELKCIDIKIGNRSRGLHFSQKFAMALSQMGISAPDTKYIIPFDHSVSNMLDNWWPSSKRVVAFNPYGSGGARRLSKENIIKIINVVLNDSPLTVCLLSKPGVEDEINDISGLYSSIDRLIFSNDDPSVEGIISQIYRSRGIISVDTATVHIAAGLNKPILGIYNRDLGGGDENFSEWHPNVENALVIFSESTDIQDVNTINMDDFRRAFVYWQRSFSV